MKRKTYALGAVVAATIRFTDTAGIPVDPSSVFFTWRIGEGASTTWTYGSSTQLTRQANGLYRADIDTTTTVGLYRYRAYSTGTYQGAEEGAFIVESQF